MEQTIFTPSVTDLPAVKDQQECMHFDSIQQFDEFVDQRVQNNQPLIICKYTSCQHRFTNLFQRKHLTGSFGPKKRRQGFECYCLWLSKRMTSTLGRTQQSSFKAGIQHKPGLMCPRWRPRSLKRSRSSELCAKHSRTAKLSRMLTLMILIMRRI